MWSWNALHHCDVAEYPLVNNAEQWTVCVILDTCIYLVTSKPKQLQSIAVLGYKVEPNVFCIRKLLVILCCSWNSALNGAVMGCWNLLLLQSIHMEASAAQRVRLWGGHFTPSLRCKGAVSLCSGMYSDVFLAPLRICFNVFHKSGP